MALDRQAVSINFPHGRFAPGVDAPSDHWSFYHPRHAALTQKARIEAPGRKTLIRRFICWRQASEYVLQEQAGQFDPDKTLTDRPVTSIHLGHV